MDENLRKIKEIILNVAREMNIEIEKIILFGSRARGDYSEESDYDILIVTREKLDREDEKNFKIKIRLETIERLDVSLDVFVFSKEEFNRFRNVKGSLIGMASLEGNIIV